MKNYEELENDKYANIPPYKFYRNRYIKATAKPHPCDVCKHTIPVGQPAEYSFTVADGKTVSAYRCIASNRGGCAYA